MKLIFATHNANKVLEIKALLPNYLQIISLTEANINEEIPEPFDTIEENSHTKAQYIYNTYHLNCFSEDTGLIVPALNGEPGVKSARYAGNNANAADNIEKILQKLNGITDRKAHFKTVITLIINNDIHQFTGICDGQIIVALQGSNGFGYDPVFVPDGSNCTFAEMNLEEKNKFSHRKKAMQHLIDFLKNNNEKL